MYSTSNLLTLILRWSLFTMFLWLVFMSHIGGALLGTVPMSEVFSYSHLMNIFIGPFWSALIIIILVNNGKKNSGINCVNATLVGILTLTLSVYVWIVFLGVAVAMAYIIFCMFEKNNELALAFGQTLTLFCSLVGALFYGIEVGSLCLLALSGSLALTMAFVAIAQTLSSLISSTGIYQKAKDYLLGKDLVE